MRRSDRAVTVIIVNFNAGGHLRAALESIQQDLASLEWDAVVVDNASTDGSADGLEAWSPRVQVIRNAANRGFGAAINQAARLSGAPLLWLLNPDCRVQPGAFEGLSRTLQEHPECAVAAPRLLNADGSIQESARGEPTAWTGVFGRHGLLTRWFPRSSIARRNLRAATLAEDHPDGAEIDWAMGACLLIRRGVFDEVGGFDERYFLYWEDADLCRRIRARGHTIRYVPSVDVIHIGEQSKRSAHRLATDAFHRSAYLYYALHVVPSRWHPARWFAFVALKLRAWWRGSIRRR